MSDQAQKVIHAARLRWAALMDLDKAREATSGARQEWWDAVAAARADHYSATELAEALDCHRYTIHRWANRGDPDRGAKDLDPDQLAALRARLTARQAGLHDAARAAARVGNSRQDVATVAGVNPASITNWLRGHEPKGDPT